MQITGYIPTDTGWRGLTPHGRPYLMAVRPGTSDWNTANASARGNDEYGIPTGLSGWAMDIGAHIGAVSVPLLLDNPDLRVIAIEGLPENVAMLFDNLRLNGVEDRALIIHALAGVEGEGTIHYGKDGEHDYIGSTFPGEAHGRGISIHGVTLRGAMLQRGPESDKPIEWMKIDCEGCEYAFLESAWLAAVKWITGECHQSADRLEEILGITHEVAWPKGRADFAPFTAAAR